MTPTDLEAWAKEYAAAACRCPVAACAERTARAAVRAAFLRRCAAILPLVAEVVRTYAPSESHRAFELALRNLATAYESGEEGVDHA